MTDEKEKRIKAMEEQLKEAVVEIPLFLTKTKKGSIIGTKDGDFHITINDDKGSFHRTDNQKKKDNRSDYDRHSDEIYMQELSDVAQEIGPLMESGDLKNIHLAFKRIIDLFQQRNRPLIKGDTELNDLGGIPDDIDIQIDPSKIEHGENEECGISFNPDNFDSSSKKASGKLQINSHKFARFLYEKIYLQFLPDLSWGDFLRMIDNDKENDS